VPSVLGGENPGHGQPLAEEPGTRGSGGSQVLPPFSVGASPESWAAINALWPG